MARGRSRGIATIVAVSASWLLLPPSAAPSPPLTDADREHLLRYARDTWKSFEALTVTEALPADGLRRDERGDWSPTAHTSPTDVATYLWGVLAAEELRIIGRDAARERIGRTFTALEGMERPHGFFYNDLDPRTAAPLTVWPGTKSRVRPFLSTVDNAWLAAALVLIRNARPEFRPRADALLAPMDFGFFYLPHDPRRADEITGVLHGGYRVDDGTFSTVYGMFNTEPRIASYLAIARGQVPREHYYRMKRVIPARPGIRPPATLGETRVYLGVPVSEGHIQYRGMRIVPSWGGSMFEALMVTLLVPEERWAPGSWGVNHPLYVRGQIEHGMDEARYGFWGFSPASSPEGGYRSYGVEALGQMAGGYTSDGVVTPHASFLALRYAPREALDNLRRLSDRFPVYGAYGFHDSVNVTTGLVSQAVLALDQGMILAAIANALADDFLRRAFVDDEFERSIRPLIAPEEFTAGPAPGAG